MPPLSDSNALARFAYGFSCPFRGFAFLAARPALWHLVVVPILLLIGAIVFAIWAVWNWLPALVVTVWPVPQNPTMGTIWGLAVASMVLVGFVVAVVVAWSVSTVISMPFYDMLAAHVEAEVLGGDLAPSDSSTLLANAAQGVAHTFLALGLYGVAMVVLMVLGLVPLVDALVPVVGVAVTTTFLARELLDVPLSRRRVSFQDKLQFLWRHFAAMQGLGTAAMLLLWAPILNFFSMPMAVVGGTLLYCRLEAEGQGVEPDQRSAARAST